MPVYQVVLNGEPTSIEAPGDTPLLWVLRDHFGLHGTKFGCGKGLCGSCTVLVDETDRRSCITPLSGVDGHRVTTIEGLSPDGTHPLQLAWIEERVPQCGYCQAGQIMNAAGLLLENPGPSDADIDRAMERVLCRCGTYLRIRRAIRTAAEGS